MKEKELNLTTTASRPLQLNFPTKRWTQDGLTESLDFLIEPMISRHPFRVPLCRDGVNYISSTEEQL